MTDPVLTPETAARLQVENETLRAECALLRDEATRVSVLNGALKSRLSIAEAERDRLARYTGTIERSRAWKLIQALRGMMGRRW